MGIFDGLDEAKTGNGFDRPDYATHGSYVLLLDETDLFLNREGQACATATLTVLSSKPVPLSNRVALVETRDASGAPYIAPVGTGRKLKFFWLLERDRKDALTFRGQYEMNRFKGFLSALLGGPDAGVTDAGMTQAVALAVMLGSSRLAQGAKPKDLAELSERVQKDFGVMLPSEKLVNLAGQVLGAEVRYSEYTPGKGVNKGKLKGNTETTLRAMSNEEQALWVKQ